MATSTELVTVGRFRSEQQAELVRGYLEAHGIDSSLQNVEIATLQSVGVGFANVLLQVCQADAAAAARLVGEWDREGAARAGGPPGDRCLACSAPLAPSDARCAACGWTWEDGSQERGPGSPWLEGGGHGPHPDG